MRHDYVLAEISRGQPLQDRASLPLADIRRPRDTSMSIMQEGPLRAGGAYDQPQAGTWVSFKMIRKTISALSIRYAREDRG
jgi:hypothetical protein